MLLFWRYKFHESLNARVLSHTHARKFVRRNQQYGSDMRKLICSRMRVTVTAKTRYCTKVQMGKKYQTFRKQNASKHTIGIARLVVNNMQIFKSANSSGTKKSRKWAVFPANVHCCKWVECHLRASHSKAHTFANRMQHLTSRTLKLTTANRLNNSFSLDFRWFLVIFFDIRMTP